MLRRTVLGTLIGALVTALTLLGGIPTATAATTPTPTTAPSDEVRPQQVTLYYDDSQAAEFKDDMEAGAAEWNAAVDNVQLEKAGPGQRAEIQIIATNGWPQANLGPVRPGGQVTIWFGRQAVQQGHDTVRIAAHELGHSLGLPDDKPGPCSSLMSGSTAGVGCTNATPNAAEAAAVERNYGTGAQGTKPADGRVLVDAP